MPSLSILLAGATGTIGRAVAADLVARGQDVTCLVRRDPGDLPSGVTVVTAMPEGVRFDAVVSCIASRTGVAADAWAVDHRANLALLEVAGSSGAARFVLLSAICVQKPELAFQRAKLAFEEALRASNINWTILRPTAFFKSLSGQVARVRAGKSFLVFGDGRATACKPISDCDLGRVVADAAMDQTADNAVVPVGGPGPAISPLDQAALLSDLLGRPVPVKRVPFWVMDAIVGGLSTGAKMVPGLAAKAELARIGRYYARESMLLFDPGTGRYDAAATPEYGSDTLRDHYKALITGASVHAAREQGVFSQVEAPETKQSRNP